jgi:hypothetical protein
MNKRFTRHCYLLLTVGVVLVGGCSVEATKAAPEEVSTASQAEKPAAIKGATIDIEANGPADTVRVFYKYLREKKFREAIYLTNLRPAIEGLTDSELKEFDGDFETVAEIVPAEIQITGEIVTGDKATVTANLPDIDGKMQVQQLELKRDGDAWFIVSVDDEQEAKIKAQGKGYFYNLRIETHENEARRMLDRISKAEMVYALQNNSLYGEMPQLVAAGYLPDDAQSADSTGYKYSVTLSADKKSYSAKAEPAVYGKSGKLTFSVELSDKGQPHLTSKDRGK